MKYKFLGKPDKRFPFLKTGKVYDLSIKEDPNKWRVLREFMEELGLNESERDVLHGFISVMFNKQ